MRLTAIVPALALAACAPTAAETATSADRAAASEDKLAAALAGLTPGEPQNCLPLTRTSQISTEAYGPTILYKYSRGLVYRTDTTGGCERVGRGDTLITRQPTGQLCSGDIGTTVDIVSRVQTGSCGFGQFTPYRSR